MVDTRIVLFRVFSSISVIGLIGMFLTAWLSARWISSVQAARAINRGFLRSIEFAIFWLLLVAATMFPLKIFEYHAKAGLSVVPSHWMSAVGRDAIMNRIDDPSIWSLVVAAGALLLIRLASKRYVPIAAFPRYEATAEERRGLQWSWVSCSLFLFSTYLAGVAHKGETVYWLLGEEANAYWQAGNRAVLCQVAFQQAIEGMLLLIVITLMAYHYAAALLAVRRVHKDVAPAGTTPEMQWAACLLGSIGPIALSSVTLAPFVYGLTRFALQFLGVRPSSTPNWFWPWEPWQGALAMASLAIPFLFLAHLAIARFPERLAYDVIRYNLLHLLCLVPFTSCAFVLWGVSRIRRRPSSRITSLWQTYRRLLTPGTIHSPFWRLWFQLAQVPFSFTTFVVFFLPKR